VDETAKQGKSIKAYDELSDLSDEEEVIVLCPGKEEENVRRQLERFEEKRILEGK